SQVDDGRGQIEQAREGVSTIRRLSSLSEYSAPAGEIVANQADRRIDAGEMEANHYQTMSNWFMTLGIIATLCGAFALIYFWKKS
nr:hypothetical protein [Chlamydiota bacterium]